MCRGAIRRTTRARRCYGTKSLMAARAWERPAWLHSVRAGTEVVVLWRAAAPLRDWLARNVGVSERPDPRR